jgi:RsiW-degrading membrane proteinase PrsW (M82 family)
VNLPGLILGFIPGFVWLAFYLEEDPHPEPRRLIAFTFILGAISTFLALFIQLKMKGLGILNALTPEGMSSGAGILALLLLAAVEEICKFGAAYLAVWKARDFDEPVDAMVYTIAAALGFATIENIGVLQGQFSSQALIAGILGITAARLVGATLLHSLSASFMGYYWALSKKYGDKIYILMGLVVATVLHAGFNFLILNYDSIVYPLTLLIIGGFFTLEDFEELKRGSA